MLTRFLYLSGGWFAISLLTTLAGGHRMRSRSTILSVAWLTTVLLVGDVWALLTFGVPNEIAIQTGIAFVFGIVWILLLRSWNAFGQVTWAMTVLATVLFMIYSFMVTAFTPLNTISFIIALDFFMIEVLALFMALTHAYESLDLFCRKVWRRHATRIEPIEGYTPMVSLHVPAYNEPPEVLEATLHSLDRLDYPNYEVLVVDNNTPGEENWLKIRNLCRRLGPKFRFVHLDKWPGYKSGALNFALAHTAPEAEIVGSIDADYMVHPYFLRDLVSAFANPKIGFVQAPQDYRDEQQNKFSESTYHGYKYFFEVSMPVRNEHNAIIFCGTMGLIRKSALQEIGGWDEWCITEDAEASLRILKRGYDSLYVKHSYGRGLMPYTFEGLKKQRFRWAFGGIQILKKHFGALMPWARWVDPHNHLTPAQRYFYLVGGLQWFTDVINLVFGVFLMLGAIASIFYGYFSVRPLTGPLLVMPAVFLFLHLLRFLWVLRKSLRLTLRTALRSMYNFFSLGWAVTLACLQGLINKGGVFLRTPKSKGQSKLFSALRVTQWESFIGGLFLVVGFAAFIVRPDFKTLWLAFLLAWQASLFLAAPYFSLLSIQTAPAQRVVQQQQANPYGGPVVAENTAAKWAWVSMAIMVGLTLVALQLPLPSELPFYARFQPPDLPPETLFEVVPSPTPTIPIIPQTGATPTASLAVLNPSPTASAQLTPTLLSSSTPTVASPTVTMLPSNTPTSSPPPSPTVPVASPSPTQTQPASPATATPFDLSPTSPPPASPPPAGVTAEPTVSQSTAPIPPSVVPTDPVPASSPTVP